MLFHAFPKVYYVFFVFSHFLLFVFSGLVCQHFSPMSCFSLG